VCECMQTEQQPKPRRRVVEAAPHYAELEAQRKERAIARRRLKATLLECRLHSKHGDGHG
jgi:hypothetical protein